MSRSLVVELLLDPVLVLSAPPWALGFVFVDATGLPGQRYPWLGRSFPGLGRSASHGCYDTNWLHEARRLKPALYPALNGPA